MGLILRGLMRLLTLIRNTVSTLFLCIACFFVFLYVFLEFSFVFKIKITNEIHEEIRKRALAGG